MPPTRAGTRRFRRGPLRRARDTMMGALLRRGTAPPGIWLLSVPGRRSGRLHASPVSVLEYESARWLVAPYGEVGWVRNVRVAGRVTLTRGTSEELVAVEVGPEEAAPVLRRYVAANPMTKRHVGAGRHDALERFVVLAPGHPVFRLAVRPTDDGGEPAARTGEEGTIRVDRAARAAAADDFGHIVHRVPEAVVPAASDRDVAAAIGWAAERDTRFAAQGRRHSTFGRSQVEGGIVGDLGGLRHVGSVEADRVVVEAGATWREVLAATLPEARTPPVLPDYLDLSVGGTIVVGGIGGASPRHGAVSDNVIEMEVVTGTGEELTCSASREAELFDAVRAGLGQVAVVTRATLRLVAAPAAVRHFSLFHPDLATMVGDERLLVADDRFDEVRGVILPAPDGGFAFRIDATRYLVDDPPDDDALLAGLSDRPAERQAATIPYLDHLDRLAALEAALRESGQWLLPHPWLMTFVGDANVEDVVGEELSRLDAPADLGPFGQVVLSPIGTRRIRSPLLRVPAEALLFTFNLVRFPTTDDAGEVSRLVEANSAVYGRVRNAGGTLYPVSALPLSREGWRDHFGPAFARLERAKRRFDPGVVLTPGYPIFDPAPGGGRASG